MDRVCFAFGQKLGTARRSTALDAIRVSPKGAVFNIIRPMVSTLIIFGGGAIVIGWLSLGFWEAAASFAYFFGLTTLACLPGRKHSLCVAGSTVLFTVICVVLLYNALR